MNLPDKPGAVVQTPQLYTYVRGADGWWYSDIGQQIRSEYLERTELKVLSEGVTVTNRMHEPQNVFAIVRDNDGSGLIYVSMRDYKTGEMIWSFDDSSGSVQWADINEPELIFEGVE